MASRRADRWKRRRVRLAAGRRDAAIGMVVRLEPLEDALAVVDGVVAGSTVSGSYGTSCAVVPTPVLGQRTCTMWSVNTRPKPGSCSIASRAAVARRRRQVGAAVELFGSDDMSTLLGR